MIGICVVTYNQEQYIGQCIESAISQVCSEPYVIYIGEDCSTDTTLEICRKYASEYPDKVKLVENQSNLGLVGNTINLLRIMQSDGCDYIAMLDGDDYWSDTRKLQKQIAYLDAHPEFGLVHTYVDSLYPDGLHVAEEIGRQEGDVFYIMENYRIGNCSVVFRTELLDMIDFENFQQQGLKSCDYVMYAIFASKWQFGFIPEHTAVWRRGIESVSGTADMEKQIRYVQNDLAHWRYLANLFPDRWSFAEEDGERYLHKCAFNIAFRFGNRERAMQEANLMSADDKKCYRKKIFCTHSAVLFWLFKITRKYLSHKRK